MAEVTAAVAVVVAVRTAGVVAMVAVVCVAKHVQTAVVPKAVASHVKCVSRAKREVRAGLKAEVTAERVSAAAITGVKVAGRAG